MPTAIGAVLGASTAVIPNRAAEAASAQSTELLITSEDPIDFQSGGFAWLRNGGSSGGGRSDEFQVYVSSGAGGDGTTQKSNGMGDVEIMCNASPLTIGNRVWIDRNLNGIQDPGEAPIPNVRILLYDAAGTLVGESTTNTNGNWSFTLANRISTTADVITDNIIRRNQPFNQSYFVVVDPAEFSAGDLVNLNTALPCRHRQRRTEQRC
ncbi:hypothetical protein HC761_01995 [bacterium]|nr:hypothetical protein [bacterium]